MATNTLKFLSTAAVVAAASLLAHAVNAQQVYRIVGPDGKVSFSDQPPPTSSNVKIRSSSGSASAGSTTASSPLPYELRQVATKYPVTLYTGENCGPCLSARALLTGRGIPFSEKTVVTADDIKVFQRLRADAALPFATIGQQQLNGFSENDWTQFLNAAGYPATSVLPSSYRQAAASPLVVVVAAPPAATPSPAQAARSAAPAALPPAASDSNPAGIKF